MMWCDGGGKKLLELLLNPHVKLREGMGYIRTDIFEVKRMCYFSFFPQIAVVTIKVQFRTLYSLASQKLKSVKSKTFELLTVS